MSLLTIYLETPIHILQINKLPLVYKLDFSKYLTVNSGDNDTQ